MIFKNFQASTIFRFKKKTSINPIDQNRDYSIAYFFDYKLQLIIINCRLVSLVGKVLVYRTGGLGSIPSQTKTQGLKIIEEKVLHLL